MEMDNLLIQRGDIYLVDLGTNTIGSEVKKTRPCVVFSNNIGNKNSQIITVLPITNRSKSQPTQVKLGKSIVEESMPLTGIIQSEQIRTVDKRRILSSRLGRLTVEGILKVEKAVMTSIGIGME
jgi:mRNA interferase MazF